MNFHLTRATLLSLGVGLSLMLTIPPLVFYHVGMHHLDKTSIVNLLEAQDATRTSHKLSGGYGPNVNFGSFTVVGTVESVGATGIVIQTSGGNLLHILINKHSNVVMPSGKKLVLSQLEKGDFVSIVARVDNGGGFIALRIIQE